MVSLEALTRYLLVLVGTSAGTLAGVVLVQLDEVPHRDKTIELVTEGDFKLLLGGELLLLTTFVLYTLGGWYESTVLIDISRMFGAGFALLFARLLYIWVRRLS